MGIEQRFEAIVVGAGPAGATAARELALRGCKVLLLERKSLPRYKPCAGGLTPKAIAQLPFAISEIPHVRVDQVAFSLRGCSPIVWHVPDNLPICMVRRVDLDYRLVQVASSAGAEVRGNEAVRSIQGSGEDLQVKTDKGTYRASFVIGADGATGVVRRSMGLRKPRRMAVAMECEIDVPESIYNNYATTAIMDYEPSVDGYGWIFPKKTHLNVGAGCMVGNNRSLRHFLRDFILRHQLASPEDIDSLTIHTYPIPLATSGERARRGNILLVGDAAAVADQFSAEGISYALASGTLAARAVSDALRGDERSLIDYESQLDHYVKTDHGLANIITEITQRFPDTAYSILDLSRRGHSAVLPYVLHEVPFSAILRRLPQLLSLMIPGRRYGRTA